MHLKTHFKFPFKSSKNSTTKASIIFFINTTLLKEHYKIWFTNFGSPELNLSNFKDAHKTRNKWTSFCTAVTDNGDPLVSRPHQSVTENRGGGAESTGVGRSSPTAASPAMASGLLWTPRPGAPVGLSRRANKRREGRRRRPWRLGGAGWRRDAGAKQDDAI